MRQAERAASTDRDGPTDVGDATIGKGGDSVREKGGNSNKHSLEKE